MERFVSLFGVGVLLGIAFLLSSDRRRVRPRIILYGLALQWVFALLILRTGPGRMVFEGARAGIAKVLGFTDHGASFLFGNLYRGLDDVVAGIGGPGPYGLVDLATGEAAPIGVVFAFHVLTTIIFFASLMGVLYHLGVMQRVVGAFAWVMRKTLQTSGAETLSCASNIFLGQTEAPLVVRPYVAQMTRSELMTVMTGGFATIAGGVLAAYVRFGIDAGHLVAASVMSAPAAVVMAKIILPETEQPATAGDVKIPWERKTANVIDAAASGAADGLRLALNVGAMLLAFIALVAMIDFFLGFIHTSLREILGTIFSPIAWAMGVPAKDMLAVGNLLGTKIAINEFVGYVELGLAKETLSERSTIIATYALCGFANLGSIAIQIGGISGIAPERRGDLARLGLRAMAAGALASWMTACIAGTLLS
ncbi:MAG: NupC/NupG family nucleoside CNT transporter [Candidatus Eisenbacteria bacterium]|nr:NupC/NupG family nucleoside CNT transporter [Candidatus Eisenbacteria bacterium]